MLRAFGNWLLDFLVPAFEIAHVPDLPAYFANTVHKSAVVEGKRACPLMDYLLIERPGLEYLHVTFGRVDGDEVVPSLQLPHRVKWPEFLASVLIPQRGDWIDMRFLLRLFTARLCVSDRHHSIHALRVFLVARYFTLKFRKVAASCSSAHVICYYDATMLGVVRAFRRLGKPVTDIQHGNLGPTHDGYNNSTAFALGSACQPSCFLVWDERFGKHVEETLGTAWRSSNYAHLRAFARRADGVRERLVVLYTLQPFTPLPPEVEQAVRTFSDVEWTFRLHPGHRAVPAEMAGIATLPNARISSFNEPLAAAISTCDLHVTYNSSVVHESAALGVCSLFLDPEFIDRFGSESSAGLARFVPAAAFCAALGDIRGSFQRDHAVSFLTSSRPS